MPGTRRPPSHTALAGAPKLAELFGSLAQMLAGRVVIGQNIRFDLAVLRHEAARADQRSLVRDLRVLDDTLGVLRSSIAG